MVPFIYRWGSNASSLQPLRGGSLLFTIQFSEIPGTHFIDLGKMKGLIFLTYEKQTSISKFFRFSRFATRVVCATG